MRNTFTKSIALVVVMILLLSVFTACNSSNKIPEGSYYPTGGYGFGAIAEGYRFYGENNVALTRLAGMMDDKTGTYSIDSGTITFTWSNGNTESHTFSRSGKTITLDGKAYEKE